MYLNKALSQLNTLLSAGLVILILGACSEARLHGSPPEIIEKTMSLKIADYCPTDGYNFNEIFAFNASTISVGDHHIADFDRDGLSDQFESIISNKTTFNISSGSPDTNGDGYSDLVINLIGYAADKQVLLKACLNPEDDTDQDGLSDCEEKTLRTNPLDPDTDGDGIPDGLEVRFGSNPSDPADSRGDSDQDSMSVLEEVKVNTPIHMTNDSRTNNKAYHYNVATKLGANSQNCYDITVGNIPLLRVNNGNLIRVMAMENKSLIGQGDVVRLRSLKVLVPEILVEDKSRIVVTDITDQLVDGMTAPLVIEDGRGD